MTKNFLLEIYSEDIPSYMQRSNAEQFKLFITKALGEFTNFSGNITCHFSQKRLSVLIHNLEPTLILNVDERRGPKTSANPKAIQGFMQSANIKKESDLIIKEIKGDSYYFSKSTSISKDLNIAIKSIIIEAINSIRFQQSMSWQGCSLKWPRPVVNVVSLLDKDVISLDSIFGIEESSKSPINEITMVDIDSADNYISIMADNNITVDNQSRVDSLQGYIENFELNNNVTCEHENLRDISDMHEALHPVMINLNFNHNLPKELLISILSNQQGYVIFKDQSGNIHNQCIAFSLIKENKNIVQGHLTTTQSRIKDAEFFYLKDLSIDNNSRLSLLKETAFLENFGTFYSKTIREEGIYNALIAPAINSNIDINSSYFNLSKCDLASYTVQEFPEVEGSIMYYFAKLNSDISEDIAVGMYDQYQPVFSGDRMPENLYGFIFSASNKFDNILSMFAAGKKVTGSSDVFGIRRSALSLIDMHYNCINNKLYNIQLDSSYCSIESIESIYKDFNVNKDVIVKASNFIFTKLVEYLDSKALERDKFNTVHFVCDKYKDSSYNNNHMINIVNIINHVLLISNLSKDNIDSIKGISIGYKRAYRLIESALKNKVIDFNGIIPMNSNVNNSIFNNIDIDAFSNRALLLLNNHDSFAEKAKNVSKYLHFINYSNTSNFSEILKSLEDLSNYVVYFVDNNQVISEDVNLRDHNLLMLKLFVTLCNSIGNLLSVDD